MNVIRKILMRLFARQAGSQKNCERWQTLRDRAIWQDGKIYTSGGMRIGWYNEKLGIGWCNGRLYERVYGSARNT